MKKPLLVIAGLGAIVAIVGGLAGIQPVLVAGAGTMLVCLLLLPWLDEGPESGTPPAPERVSSTTDQPPSPPLRRTL